MMKISRATCGQKTRALEYVIDVYGGLIQCIVRKHLYQFPHCHDECINDILLAVWNGSGQFDPQKNTFKNWIAAISKYKCIDYKRQCIRRLREVELTPETESQDTGSELLREELREEVESILQFLRPAERKLYIERYMLDKDIPTLAREMNTKPSAIYNKLSRGKKRILRSLFPTGRGKSEPLGKGDV